MLLLQNKHSYLDQPGPFTSPVKSKLNKPQVKSNMWDPGNSKLQWFRIIYGFILCYGLVGLLTAKHFGMQCKNVANKQK